MVRTDEFTRPDQGWALYTGRPLDADFLGRRRHRPAAPFAPLSAPVRAGHTCHRGTDRGGWQMAEHPNAQVIRKGYEAFSTGDMATLAELFTQDVQWHEAGGSSVPMAGDFKGQEAVFGMFAQIIQQTSEFSVTLEEVIADDHQAVAIHEAYARRGATTYRSREAIVFHLLAGKVTDAWHTVPDLAAYEMLFQAPLNRTTPEENIALTRRGYAAFDSGDLAALTEILDEDCVWHVTGVGDLDGDYVGRAATFGFFAALAQEFGGTFKLDVHDILANEEHVTVLCTTSATRNGKELRMPTVHVYHVRDGKTVECWSAVTDPQAALDFMA